MYDIICNKSTEYQCFAPLSARYLMTHGTWTPVRTKVRRVKEGLQFHGQDENLVPTCNDIPRRMACLCGGTVGEQWVLVETFDDDGDDGKPLYQAPTTYKKSWSLYEGYVLYTYA